MKKNTIIAVSIPVILGVVTYVLIGRLGITDVTFPHFEFLLNSIITSATTISGFILAAVTILVGATSSAIMKDIRNEGGLQELRWRYTETLILALIVIVFFTILGGIVDEKNIMTLPMLSNSAGLIVAYLSSTISTCYYLLAIIGRMYYEAPEMDATPSSPEGLFRIGSDKT